MSLFDHFTWGEVIATGIFLMSGAGAVVTVTFFVNRRFQDLSDKFSEKIDQSYRDSETRCTRIYQRFDEFKQTVEQKYVRRDMCTLLHDSTATSIYKLESKLDTLTNKFDDLKNLILKTSV